VPGMAADSRPKPSGSTPRRAALRTGSIPWYISPEHEESSRGVRLLGSRNPTTARRRICRPWEAFRTESRYVSEIWQSVYEMTLDLWDPEYYASFLGSHGAGVQRRKRGDHEWRRRVMRGGNFITPPPSARNLSFGSGARCSQRGGSAFAVRGRNDLGVLGPGSRDHRHLAGELVADLSGERYVESTAKSHPPVVRSAARDASSTHPRGRRDESGTGGVSSDEAGRQVDRVARGRSRSAETRRWTGDGPRTSDAGSGGSGGTARPSTESGYARPSCASMKAPNAAARVAASRTRERRHLKMGVDPRSTRTDNAPGDSTEVPSTR